MTCIDLASDMEISLHKTVGGRVSIESDRDRDTRAAREQEKIPRSAEPMVNSDLVEPVPHPEATIDRAEISSARARYPFLSHHTFRYLPPVAGEPRPRL